jgi:predicted RNA-binding protein YlqC (UPF0109 family)
MSEIDIAANLLLVIVRMLVKNPDNVVVQVLPESRGGLIRVSVAPQDLGLVIGRQGRTVRSLRTILAAIRSTTSGRIALDIV